MKQTFFIFLLLSWCFTAICQTGKLTGRVLDAQTGTTLELATVSIFGKDSSLFTYQLSDKEGKFQFDKLPLKQKLLVSITYTGYTDYKKSIQLEDGKKDTLAVFLELNNRDSLGVVVSATIPVRMNGDTLEISPAAFKMKPDAVLEELLNQVPGITIWSDGSITMNGQKIQNLFVDGKPFLGASDPRIATQNLPKAAIDRIQLYQEYDRSNIGQQKQPQDSVLTMNIKLKESSKKGYFGKAGAGYGTTERYEGDLSLQMYNKKSSLGIGGGINNINKGIGNLQELFQNNTYRNYNPNLYSVGRFGGEGISRNHSIGSILTHNFIETENSSQSNRLTVNYNLTGTEGFVTNLELQERANIDNPQFIRSEGVQVNNNNNQNLSLNYVKTNSYNDNLSLNGSLDRGNGNGQTTRFTEVRDSANGLQSTNNNTTLHKQRSDNANINLSLAKSNREDPLKGFNLNINAGRGNRVLQSDVNNSFRSFIEPSQNLDHNRDYTTKSQSSNISGTLDYHGFKRMLLGRHDLFGIQLNFSQSANYTKQAALITVRDFDSTAKRYIPNNAISNQNQRETFEYVPSIAFSKNFSKWADRTSRNFNVRVKLSEEFKMDQNASSFSKRNLSRNFQFFRYEGNLNFNYHVREKYQFNMYAFYSKSFNYPSIDLLYTIVDDVNAYEIRIGNPMLQNQVNNQGHFNVNFNTQNPKSLYSINGSINGGYSHNANPVADSIINEPSGKRRTYFVNVDRRNNLNVGYNFSVGRKIDKSSLQLKLDGNYNTGKMPNYIDGFYNTSQTGSHFNQYRLQFTLRSVLVLNVGQGFQAYQSKQSAGGLMPFKNRNTTTKLGAVLNYPTNFTFSSTLERLVNSNLDEPTLLWNAFATYRFMKQQGELKLSAMDMLKQYKNIINYSGPYGTTTRISNGLQQYFLLTFSYYPRKFGKAEIKKQSQDFSY